MDCSEAKNEIVALLYGEIDARTRAELERHLGACASCREEHDANRRTVRLLDEWDAPPLLVAPGRARTPRRRVVPVLVGIAAALVAFASLVAVGASVRVERGGLVLSLGAAAAPSDDVEPVARAIVRQELERALTPIVEEIVDVDRRAAAGQSFLVRAIDRRRVEDAARYEAALRTVALGLASDVERTRRAVGDVVLWAANASPSAVDAPSGK